MNNFQNIRKVRKYFFVSLNSFDEHPERLMKNILQVEANIVNDGTFKANLQLSIMTMRLVFYLRFIETVRPHQYQQKYIFSISMIEFCF